MGFLTSSSCSQPPPLKKNRKAELPFQATGYLILKDPWLSVLISRWVWLCIDSGLLSSVLLYKSIVKHKNHSCLKEAGVLQNCNE